MIIKYKNYTIEEDRRWYILTTYWPSTKWKNIWEVVKLDQVYPSTLEKCLMNIAHTEKKDTEAVTTLEWYIEKISKINNKLVKDIKTIVNNI